MSRQLSPSRGFSFRWSKQWPPGLSVARCSQFRSGREALYALARHCCPQGEGSVLLPVWVPEGVYLPFERAGWEIHFYNLDHQADPAWTEVEALLTKHSFDLVVLIHYFGIPRATKKLAQLLPAKTPILEDWAHSYPHISWPPSTDNHWILFSPTKIIGTTDGAWLLGAEDISPQRSRTFWIDRYSFWQLLYLSASTLLQRRTIGQSVWRRLAGGAYRRAYHLLLHGIEQANPVSRLGQWLIMHTPHAAVVTKRQAQARAYEQRLQRNRLRFLGKENFGNSPMIGFPLWVENPVHFAAYLAQHGIRGQRFTDRWWFAPEDKTGHFQRSKALMDHHFLLPINQHFSREDTEYIIRIVNAYLRSSAPPT